MQFNHAAVMKSNDARRRPRRKEPRNPSAVCGKPWLALTSSPDQHHPVVSINDDTNRTVLRPLRDVPCSLLSCFGSPGHGKSFLLNALAGQPHLFAPCTQGIELASHVMPIADFADVDANRRDSSLPSQSLPPATSSGQRPVVAFADSHGFSPDRELILDASLALPVLIASRATILSWRGARKWRDCLNELTVLAEAASLMGHSSGDGNESSRLGGQGDGSSESPGQPLLGHLFIVMRDWPEAECSAKTAEEIQRELLDYEPLGRVNLQEAAARNDLRAKINRYFESFTVCLLPPPYDSDGERSAGFTTALSKLRASLVVRLHEGPQLFGSALTAEHISWMVPSCVEALNKGHALTLSALMRMVAESRLRSDFAAEQQKYDEHMEQLGADIRGQVGMEPSALQVRLDELQTILMDSVALKIKPNFRMDYHGKCADGSDSDGSDSEDIQIAQQVLREVHAYSKDRVAETIDENRDLLLQRLKATENSVYRVFDEQFNVLEASLPLANDDIEMHWVGISEGGLHDLDKVLPQHMPVSSNGQSAELAGQLLEQLRLARRRFKAHAQDSKRRMLAKNKVATSQGTLREMGKRCRRFSKHFADSTNPNLNEGFDRHQMDVGGRLLYLIKQRTLKPAADVSKVVGRLLATQSFECLQPLTEREEALTEALFQLGIESVSDCPHKSRGCMWKGAVVKAHLPECAFRLVRCIECGESVLSRDMTKHGAETCPRRPQHCPLCNEVYVLCEKAEHDAICPRALVHCDMQLPNGEICGQEMERRALPRHKAEECMLRAVRCEHCGLKLLARRLEEHFNTCPCFPLGCPNNCGEQLKRSQWAAHTDPETGDCRLAKVQCKICGETMLRTQLKSHENDPAVMRLHIHKLSQQQRKHDHEMQQMKSTVETLAGIVSSLQHQLQHPQLFSDPD